MLLPGMPDPNAPQCPVGFPPQNSHPPADIGESRSDAESPEGLHKPVAGISFPDPAQIKGLSFFAEARGLCTGIQYQILIADQRQKLLHSCLCGNVCGVLVIPQSDQRPDSNIEQSLALSRKLNGLGQYLKCGGAYGFGPESSCPVDSADFTAGYKTA
ncbi:hypothetical protein D3C76_1099560 [compost metagenome]